MRGFMIWLRLFDDFYSNGWEYGIELGGLEWDRLDDDCMHTLSLATGWWSDVYVTAGGEEERLMSVWGGRSTCRVQLR